MTSKQIEALVEQVQNEMEQELGVRPEIYVNNVDDAYEVQIHYSSDEHEIIDTIAGCLLENELEEFLTSGIHQCIRDFYYGIEHGGSMVQRAKVLLAEWVLENKLLPADVYVDIRWNGDRDIGKHYCISCSEEAYEVEQQAAVHDDSYFFYCNGIEEFFNLCEHDNGEDFEIIEVHGWD